LCKPITPPPFKELFAIHITIIGTSSGVGLLAVQQALAKGHHVTTLSRTTATLPPHLHLTTVVGSATVAADLRQVLPSADTVVITVGTTKKNATRLFTETARALLEATAEAPLAAPVLVLTGFGAGASAPYLSWWMRGIIHFFLKQEYADKTRLEELLATSNLQWEIVRPGMLTNGPLTDTYHVLPTLSPGMKVGRIALLHHYPALTA
jgi:putative NADH-flavin reductase